MRGVATTKQFPTPTSKSSSRKSSRVTLRGEPVRCRPAPGGELTPPHKLSQVQLLEGVKWRPEPAHRSLKLLSGRSLKRGPGAGPGAGERLKFSVQIRNLFFKKASPVHFNDSKHLIVSQIFRYRRNVGNAPLSLSANVFDEQSQTMSWGLSLSSKMCQ